MKAVFVPFANLGIWYKDPENKSDKKSKTYSYAICCEGIFQLEWNQITIL
jgi:hypothetical protein